MLNSQKHVFWQAFLVTLLIFGIGIVFGILLENSRVGNIDKIYQESELDLMDIKLQSEIYSTGLFNCEDAIRENIKFAEKIYSDAKLLERYESSSEITTSLESRHKKFDLLRANLFLNSIKIRENCNTSYYEVVYIYKYKNPSLDTKARQNTFSKLLMLAKEKSGEKILLIPLAGDNDLSSVRLLMSRYDISEDELPIIIINGNKKINELLTIDEFMREF